MDAGSAPPFELRREALLVSTDPARLDFDLVHGWISRSYWASGIPRETLRRALAGSLCFGLYEDGRQLGLARVITDGATFAYLCDVYVDDARQRTGLGSFLMECVHAHPALQGLRRWALITRDAQGLYRKVGYQPLAQPERWMERHTPNAYERPS